MRAADRVAKMKFASDLPLALIIRLDDHCRKKVVKKCDVLTWALEGYLNHKDKQMKVPTKKKARR